MKVRCYCSRVIRNFSQPANLRADLQLSSYPYAGPDVTIQVDNPPANLFEQGRYYDVEITAAPLLARSA